MQHRFVMKLFTAAQGMDIHTALDTNGYLGDRLSDTDLNAIDLVLLDIKAWNRDLHFQLTGMDLDPVLNFARRLASQGKPIWLRYVLVPGVTDEPRDIANIARFAADLGVVQRVDVLPFHQMGRFKWETLGLDYKLKGTDPPSQSVIENACAQFREVGLTVY